MISFLSPLWLSLLALAIPLVAFHAWRRKTLAVPSVILWRQVAGRYRARPRFALPRINWPLALQLLGLAALALALAQPYWGSRASDQAVYLVDVSGPMQAFDTTGKTRIDAARSLVADSMAEALLAGAEVTIIAVGRDPLPLASRQTRLGGLTPLLPLLQADDGIADWPAAFALAESLMPEAGAVTWHLVTPDTPALPATKAVIRALSPALAIPPSLGLTGNAAPELPDEMRPRPAGGALLRLSGRVTATPGAVMPESLPLQFHPHDGGAAQDYGRLGLAATDDPLVMRFSAVQSLPEAGMLSVTLPDDATPHDNLLVFDSLIARPARVLLLQDPAGAGDDDPVKRALIAVFGQVDEAAALPAPQASYDAVVVNALTLPARPAGNVLWLNGAGLEGARPAPVTGRLDRWTRDHPASASLPFAQGDSVTFTPLPALEGGHVLAAMGAQPVISARRLVQGVEMRAALDPVASGWSGDDMLLRLLMGFADWAAIGPKGVTACDLGGACRLPAHLALQEIGGPDGSARAATALPPDTVIPDSMARFAPARVGLYHLADGRPLVIRKPESAAVQTAPQAGEPLAPQSVALAPWLLLLAIAVLVAEAARAWHNGHRGALSFALRAVAIAALGCAYLGLALPRPSQVPLVRAVGSDGPLAETILRTLAEIPADAPARLRYSGSGFDPVDALAGVLPHLAARATALDVVPALPAAPATVTIRSLDLPPQARVGDVLPVSLQVENPQDSAVTLPFTLMANGAVAVADERSLAPGLNRIDTEITLSEAGLLRLTFAFGAETPPTRAALPVTAAPKALIIARNTNWGAYLGEALALQGMEVEVTLPAGAPLLADSWLERDLIILADVSAAALTYGRMQQIETAVRDHGRALMILGGANAFAGGGYFATPLEALSPLSAKVPQDAPLASVVFVVDRSGSMLSATGIGTRLDVARVATVSAAHTLDPQSLLAVVAFDARPHLMLPLTQSPTAALLEEALREVNPGGGTAVLPALDMAISVLGSSNLPLRHIVVMTDGQIERYPLDDTIARARAAGITISAIGIGEQGRSAALVQLAEEGGGTFHYAQDIRALPAIATQEAMRLAGDPVERGDFTPYWTSDRSDPTVAGLSASLPPLAAFTRTTLREEADLHLAITGPDGEVPIMATWQQGAGQVLAFAGPAAGGGAEAWMADPAYPRFWAQIARQMLADSAPPGLSVATTRINDRLVIDMTRLLPVDPAVIEDPSGLARLSLTAPDGSARHVVMGRTGDFTWRGDSALDQAGHWQIHARHGVRETRADLYVGALAQQGDATADIAALSGVAAMTGGQRLDPADVPAALPASWRWHLDPARSPWVLLGLLVLMADLAARYLRGTRARQRSPSTR